MKIRIIAGLLTLTLVACASVQPGAVDTQSTLNSLIQTSIVQTQTAFPAVASLLPTFMPTAIRIYPTPSLIPTEPSIVVLTPNTTQLEGWRDYQMELAKLVLSQAGAIYPYYESALCEWDILGSSEQEVIYLWVACSTSSASAQKPALVHLNMDGSIQNVEVVFSGYSWDADVQKLFPQDIVEKIHMYSSSPQFSGRPFELQKHLAYRETHPEEPPLIVLSGTPMP